MIEKRKEKKRSLLDPDRLFWRAVSGFMDLVYVSILWFFCSIPIVTVGAATTAMYSTVVHCIRRGEEGMLHRFFTTFKSEFKTATLSWLTWLAGLLFCLVLGIFLMAQEETVLGMVFRVNLVVTCVVVLGALVWVFPVVSRFEMSFLRLNLTAVKLVFQYFPVTLILGALMIPAAFACYIWMYPVLILPALLSWLFSLYMERIFVRLAPQPEEDLT